MARIVPSQVVEMIDQMFPQAKDESQKAFSLELIHLPQLSAIISLIEQIPPELINVNGRYYMELEASRAAIKTAMQCWQGPGGNNRFELNQLKGFSALSPITLIRRALAECRDAYPAASTTDLKFITDPDLSEALRIDLGSTNLALSNGEWKAATVLAGSIVEALLLWALQQRTTTEIQNAIVDLKSKSVSINHNASNLEDWLLYELIEVSEKLKIIIADTAKQARLAKDFRNLIHPGRNIRLRQTCNRATALSAVAAVEHVIEDLK
ncbi:MAG: hypothetical protein WC405_04685 [Syntrophales bacterium]